MNRDQSSVAHKIKVVISDVSTQFQFQFKRLSEMTVRQARRVRPSVIIMVSDVISAQKTPHMESPHNWMVSPSLHSFQSRLHDLRDGSLAMWVDLRRYNILS
jgi:hypothetical protein